MYATFLLFFITHIQTEKISSWNGPIVHVCCFMLARESIKTFVSRIHIHQPSPKNGEKNLHQPKNSLAGSLVSRGIIVFCCISITKDNERVLSRKLQCRGTLALTNLYSTQVIVDHPRNTSQNHLLLAQIHFPHLPHSLITHSSIIIHSQHTIISCNNISKSIPEGPALLQYLYNIVQCSDGQTTARGPDTAP